MPTLLTVAVLGFGKWSWIGFFLPLGLDSVEGSEAALLVAAAAKRGSWKKAVIAALAAVATLIPVGAGLYFLFKYVNASYLDYAIALIIFLLGANELREGISERFKKKGGSSSEAKDDAKQNSAGDPGWKAVWPAYFGVILESSEAMLYTFAVSHGTASWQAATAGAAIGFILPWVGLSRLRKTVDRMPKWKVETTIGIVLMSAAAIFGILHVIGIING